MQKGRIIFINGVTSSGKTSIVETLQEREEIKPHYEQLMEILKDNPLDIVEVYCPMEICKKRNFLREDRYEAQSEEQLELMAKNIKYSMKVDTSVYTPAECAEIIVKELFV